MQVIVLCGGRGIRMSEHTQTRQKCLLNFRGKPILEWVLETISNDFEKADVILSIGYLDKQIARHFGTKYKGLKLRYTSPNEKGTKEALIEAGKLANQDHFFLIDGDIILEKGQLPLLIKEGYLGSVFCCQDDYIAPTHPLLKLENELVKEIWYTGEKIHAPGHWRWMSVGYWSYDLLSLCAKSHHNSICRAVSDNLHRQVRAVQYKGTWHHFAQPEDFLK